MAVEFGADIDGPQGMNTGDLGQSLTSYLVPSAAQTFRLSKTWVHGRIALKPITKLCQPQRHLEINTNSTPPCYTTYWV